MDNSITMIRDIVIGGLIGASFNQLLGMTGAILGFGLSEKRTLTKLNAEIKRLDDIVLNEKNGKYLQTMIAKELQKTVYKSIKEFSTASYRATLLAAQGAAITGIGQLMSLASDEASSISNSLTLVGLSVALIGATYQLYHHTVRAYKVTRTIDRHCSESMSSMGLRRHF